jgi:predicted membrane protein
MPALDRSYVVADSDVVPCARAAFVASHHTLRPWRGYTAYAAFGLVAAVLAGNPSLLIAIPGAVLVDAISRFRRVLHAVRTQEPVGTVVALGFGDHSFSFRTWTEAREVPYSAITRIVRSHGCVVICAMSHCVFWALPERMVPDEDVARMTAASRATRSDGSPRPGEPKVTGQRDLRGQE